MKPAFSISPVSERDIAKSFQWYEEQKEGLGIRFVQELEAVFKEIETYSIVYLDFRRAFPHHFPYSVYYGVEKDQIIIHAVLHQRRELFLLRKRYPIRN